MPNLNDKTRITDTHVFFLNGAFSQWYPCEFAAPLYGQHDSFRPLMVLRFNCAEQYMMAAKAALFDDLETLEEIMKVEQGKDWRDAPRQHKALGRSVKNFNEEIWKKNCFSIVENGNQNKFRQNDDLREFLLSTDKRHLVEGAHYDRIWGVGLAWDDPRIDDPANWQGTNWLGEVLMKVRDRV